jgi:phosphonatase-like hydrolase
MTTMRDDRSGLACLDMAGTTVDDGSAVLDSFAVALDGVGIRGLERDAGLEHAAQSMGQSKIEVFTTILDGDASLSATANMLFEAHYEHVVRRGGVRPMAGAAEAIAELRQAGVKVCLTTGFSPSTRDAVISTFGWESSIDLALSPVDAGRGRPWPDMVLAAVMRLRIEAVHDVAVVGDTVNDLWSGHRAGARIVAGVLTGAHDLAALSAAPHTHILDSIADVPAVMIGRSLISG